ncbi:MAG: cytochrome C [Verrucomicrobiales bacterium]|nr:cytochrome C [Verrucomicrobiales bacterium]
MPIFEYYCPENHTLYQFLTRNPAHRDIVPLCPQDPSFHMEKRVSRFAIIGRAKEESDDDPFAGIDDAKMEAMMMDLEKDMTGMDDDNPDPRQLGHVMRKMTDLMGDKAPAELREMVRRLEAGEDPEKLEEEFGGGGEDGDDPADALFASVIKKVRGRRPGPRRDPKLYELRDFLPPDAPPQGSV